LIFEDFSGLNGKNKGYIILFELLNACYGFSGYKTGGHLAEETTNTSEAAPKGKLSAIFSCYIVGLLFILGLLYSIGDNLEGVLDG
jgi:amino acid transporter